MKLQFDPNQEYQLDAINAIVDIFEGQAQTSEQAFSSYGLLGVYPNVLNLSKDEVFANVRKVQARNKIGTDQNTEDFDFSIEMETGTGKTYVYLRTVFELNKRYGWKKFIVLVPSIAIREGVIKTLELTKEHFSQLYDGIPYRYYEYTSKNISEVKHFAESDVINILVMTVGAFNRDSNVLYGERDQMQGVEPISFIQKINPILILDEPQKIEGPATKQALENFKSLFRLRYSATHKDIHNLMYQLTPYDAYMLGLVKRIEVYSVTDDETSMSVPLLRLVDTKSGKTASSITARLELVTLDKSANRKVKTISVKRGDGLNEKSGNPAYEEYVVSSIDVEAPDFGAEGKVHFSNGFVLTKQNAVEQNKQDIMRRQIAQTIRLHFEKRKKHLEKQIKVLSLFFIDRVDNYVSEDGFIRTTFIEEFDRQKKEFGFDALDVARAHKGYFAKRGDEYLQREKAIEENDEAYELIMKDKERLLSFDEQTEFIFSHSALREGWDNPNIFNICTLNMTASTMKKRQEIGRGMRLCVNQEGTRVFDRPTNLLSVVANESYADYVAKLQGEFYEDGIYKAPPVPSNARKRKVIKLKKDFDKDADFLEIWRRISAKTRFTVRVDQSRLVKEAADAISNLKLDKPQVRVERVGININEVGVSHIFLGDEAFDLTSQARTVDCIEFIKRETKLTRATIVEILEKAGNYTALFNNPERYCFEVARIIKELLLRDYVEQISYELLPERYDASQFKDIEAYEDTIKPVTRSIYEAVVLDSDVEKKFTVDLDCDERIKLFIKLPDWFKITTPVGGYNPDWAVVTVKRDLQGNESGERVYFVIETKGDVSELRPSEQAKITAAKKHFQVISVNYREVEDYNQFVKQL